MTPENRSGEEPNSIQHALALAGLVLSSSPVEPGGRYEPVHRYKLTGNIFRGNLGVDKVLKGYRLTSRLGVLAAPWYLDRAIKTGINERASTGTYRLARVALWLPDSVYRNVNAMLSEYRQAPPRATDNTEKTPAPRDALYVFSATASSSDGRPPGTTPHEITFSANGILGYAEMDRPTELDAIDQQYALGVLKGYLTSMHEKVRLD